MSPLEHAARAEACPKKGKHAFVNTGGFGIGCSKCFQTWTKYWQPVGLRPRETDTKHTDAEKA